MLQHNEYSREGWLAARHLLSQFVYQGLTPAAARKRDRKQIDSGQRTWNLTKGPKLAGVESIVWSRTIADVWLDTPSLYCADVQEWAVGVLSDTESLMQVLEKGLSRSNALTL